MRWIKKTLLIITQKVDERDHTLGFFVDWIRALALEYQSVLVICLAQGKFNLPANIKVLSLGKETGRSRLKYLYRLARYLWQERKNYQRVLVHMNQEYVLLAGWWWHLTAKPIDFWYNHRFGSWCTRLAVAMADRVFCTSPQSYTARFSKTKLVPAGIDIAVFRPDPSIVKNEHTMVYVGRLSPVKRVDLLIRAALLLDQWGVDFYLEIVGCSAGPEDRPYQDSLLQQGRELVAKGKLKFLGALAYPSLPKLYNRSKLVVNLTPSGSFDKVIFEAMACETLVLTANSDLRTMVPAHFFFTGNEPEVLAAQIKQIFGLPQSVTAPVTAASRRYVQKRHSLPLLINLITRV